MEERGALLLLYLWTEISRVVDIKQAQVVALEERLRNLEAAQGITNARIASAGGSMLHLGKERVG
jgi:hypothetical protein